MDRKALKIYAGFTHCMAITSTDVLVWGSNKEGQLGIALDKAFAEEPIVIDELSGKNVKKG
jgi:alpha-tubulin suppressor-like RCC1 family protein